MKLSHEVAPIYDALKKLIDDDTIPFDVPGHKRGRGNKYLQDFLGEKAVKYDVNSSKSIDNPMHPTGVVREAEKLFADLFDAQAAFLMVNGTTSGVQAMITSTCRQGEKIIMPRNVHKSAINALILSGAVPVYIEPGIDKKLGISLGLPIEKLKQAIIENPDAKAVFINNPTYYGICSNVQEIVKIAHENNMLVLADEAHGSHLYFNSYNNGAIKHGADMAALSIHKTGGSLTQSSVLLVNSKNVDPNHVRSVINITQTTSSSYLLLASLDLSRKQLALNGKKMVKKMIEIANYARDQIEKIGSYIVFSKKLINGDTIFDYDLTKLSINISQIGISGFEMVNILRDDYKIIIEYGDANNIMCIIGLDESKENIDKLISALADIKNGYSQKKPIQTTIEFIEPKVAVSPREAFYARKMPVLLKDSVGYVSGEFIMCYPPGIPVVAPGELISQEAIDYILYSAQKGSVITGTEDLKNEYINILVY